MKERVAWLNPLPENDLPAIDMVTLRIFGILADPKREAPSMHVCHPMVDFLTRRIKSQLPQDTRTRSDFAELSRRLATRLSAEYPKHQDSAKAVKALTSWAEMLEKASPSA